MGISIEQVTKRFQTTVALDNVSLRLDEGHLYGLLGNNGAGKTTLLSIMTNRLFADSGQVKIDGEPAAGNDAALSKLFFSGDSNLYPEDLRVKGAFDMAARFYPGFDRAYAEALSKQFGLNTKKKITALSTGYASIFRLIVALSVNTPWLLLDEPVLGLDAQHRDLFYQELLKKFALGGCSILLSTHLIAEVDGIVDHAVIIRNGKILRNADTESLISGCYAVSGPASAVDAYLSGKTVLESKPLGGLKTACIDGPLPDAPAPSGLEFSKIGLQDYFISLMNAEDHKA